MLPPILNSAIEIARIGFHSFPVNSVKDGICQCGNPNCRSKGKHPRITNWKNRATKNEQELKELFNDNDNLGILTGSKSNLIVLDIDPKNGGNESYKQLTQQYGALDEHTLVANTGGGGFHLLYQYDGGKIGNFNGSVFGEGIDIKGNGGFIVGAPSTHLSGNNYYWRDGFYMPAELPLELESAIISTRPKTFDEHENASFEKKDIQQGFRNTRLTQIAGRYRSRGYEVNRIIKELSNDNITRCKPPLSDSEIDIIARSISKYPKGESQESFKSFWLKCVYNDSAYDLDHGTKGVLTALSYLMDDNGGNCTAPQDIIAAKAGCSVPTVSKQLSKANNLGWITQYLIPKTNGGKGIYSRYIANIPPHN